LKDVNNLHFKQRWPFLLQANIESYTHYTGCLRRSGVSSCIGKQSVCSQMKQAGLGLRVIWTTINFGIIYLYCSTFATPLQDNFITRDQFLKPGKSKDIFLSKGITGMNSDQAWGASSFVLPPPTSFYIFVWSVKSM
jgi:hypothetical protein